MANYWPRCLLVLPLSLTGRVLKATEKESRQREYSKISLKDKATIMKHAIEHSVAKALWEIGRRRMRRNWRSGAGVLLWEMMFKWRFYRENTWKTTFIRWNLQELIGELRTQGTPICSFIIVAVTRRILLMHKKTILEEFGGSVTINCQWAKQVLKQMGFSKKRANSKTKILSIDFDCIKKQYLLDIEAVTSLEEIPAQLVLNWDQTALKIAPSSNWIMEKHGPKHVEIAAVDEAMSNEAIIVLNINCIFIPYVQKTRLQLKLSSDHPALTSFDVWKGQCMESLFNELEENTSCTSLFQLTAQIGYNLLTWAWTNLPRTTWKVDFKYGMVIILDSNLCESTRRSGHVQLFQSLTNPLLLMGSRQQTFMKIFLIMHSFYCLHDVCMYK